MSNYTDTDSLLIGDVDFAPDVKTRFVNGATTEIDSELGFVYTLPLNPTPTGHVALILKQVATLIASGRLIMDRALAGEDLSLQSYGKSLLKEGHDKLAMIRNGQIDLQCDKVASQAADGNAPSIIQGDEFSSMDTIYAWFNTPAAVGGMDPYYGPVWQPGYRA